MNVCTNLNDQILHLNMNLNELIIQKRYYISKLADCKCCIMQSCVILWNPIMPRLCNIEKPVELVRLISSSGVIHGEILLQRIPTKPLVSDCTERAVQCNLTAQEKQMLFIPHDVLLIHCRSHVFERLKRTLVFDTAEKKHSFLDEEIKATKVFLKLSRLFQSYPYIYIYVYIYIGRCYSIWSLV